MLRIYTTRTLVGPKGFEPLRAAYQADILPIKLRTQYWCRDWI